MNPHPNVDTAEVNKFDALAARWWDPEGDLKTLHEINPLRLSWIIEQAGDLAGKQVLDVGCGGGILSEALAAAGADTTGIDMAESSLQVARLHLLESGHQVTYRLASAEALASETTEEYDIITCMELLEHVPDPLSVIQSCARLLRPGGHLFLSTLNRNPKAYLFAILGAEYLLRLLPTGTHEYSKFITPSELMGWVRAAGLQGERTCGLNYNPLNRHHTLDPKDISVNYMLHCRKPD